MPVDYQKQLDGIKTTFSLARGEYLKAYPQAKMYPNVDSYQQSYKRAKDIIISSNADIFTLENELRGNVSSLGKDIESINEKIAQIKSTNQKLEDKSSNMEGADKGANVRFINSRQLSYTALYRTIFLTMIGIYTIGKLRSQT